MLNQNTCTCIHGKIGIMIIVALSDIQQNGANVELCVKPFKKLVTDGGSQANVLYDVKCAYNNVDCYYCNFLNIFIGKCSLATCVHSHTWKWIASAVRIILIIHSCKFSALIVHTVGAFWSSHFFYLLFLLA